MSEEFIESTKYHTLSFAGKVISYYVVPSLFLGLDYYESKSFTYLILAALLANVFNFLNHLLFSYKYKGQVCIEPMLNNSFCCS